MCTVELVKLTKKNKQKGEKASVNTVTHIVVVMLLCLYRCFVFFYCGIHGVTIVNIIHVDLFTVRNSRFENCRENMLGMSFSCLSESTNLGVTICDKCCLISITATSVTALSCALTVSPPLLTHPHYYYNHHHHPPCCLLSCTNHS